MVESYPLFHEKQYLMKRIAFITLGCKLNYAETSTYERELLNPLNGFSGIAKDYEIEECEVEGHLSVRLTPKRAGDTIYIVTSSDGESISRIKYGVGANSAEVVVTATRRTPKSLPKFSKERYKGFELIDFR